MAPLRARARDLRAQQLGYQAIADACGISLATAWRWTHDVPVMTADEHAGVRRPMTAERRAALSVAMLAVWARRRVA